MAFLLPKHLSGPQNLIFAGLAGCLGFGLLTFVEFSGPAFKPLAESELTYFRGRAANVVANPMSYGAINYRIWLEDQPVAFQQLRISGEDSIDPAEFRAIPPEAEIVVGVEAAKVDKPGKDRKLEPQFLSFVSLEADRKIVASLADFNARRAEMAGRDPDLEPGQQSRSDDMLF